MLQFIYEGQEYTTRTRLLDKYDITPTRLHYLLERSNLTKIEDGNKFFFLKNEVEAIIEECLKK